MTDRTFERAVLEWLEDGSDRTPAPALDAVLLAVKTTPQQRDLRIPWRFTPMPTYLRLAAGIAALAVLGSIGLALFNGPGGPGGPKPSPTPSSSATPTQAAVALGTITLTEDDCTWTGNPGSLVLIGSRIDGSISVVNQTDTFANFGLYRLEEGFPWAEAEAWVIAENAALQGGPSHPPEQDFATGVGSLDAPDRGQSSHPIQLSRGTFGFLCSSNEPPPGSIFAVYIVGPLEITEGP